MWMVAAKTLNNQSQQPTMGGPLGLGEGLTNPRFENRIVTKCYTEPWKWTDSLERPRQRKMNTVFGT